MTVPAIAVQRARPRISICPKSPRRGGDRRGALTAPGVTVHLDVRAWTPAVDGPGSGFDVEYLRDRAARRAGAVGAVAQAQQDLRVARPGHRVAYWPA